MDTDSVKELRKQIRKLNAEAYSNIDEKNSRLLHINCGGGDHYYGLVDKVIIHESTNHEPYLIDFHFKFAVLGYADFEGYDGGPYPPYKKSGIKDRWTSVSLDVLDEKVNDISTLSFVLSVMEMCEEKGAYWGD